MVRVEAPSVGSPTTSRPAWVKVSAPAPKSKLVAPPPALVKMAPVLFSRSAPPEKLEAPAVCQLVSELLLNTTLPVRPENDTRPLMRPALLTMTLPPTPRMALSS